MTIQRFRDALCIDWQNLPDSPDHAMPHGALNGHRALRALERSLSQYHGLDITRVITRPFGGAAHYVRTFVEFTYVSKD